MADFQTHLVPWLAADLSSFEARIEGDRMPHAVLLEGPGGIGKLNLALNIATRLTVGPTSYAELDAESAREALVGQDEWMPAHPDVHLVRNEPGKSVLGVDSVRSVIETLRLTGHGDLAKVAVICPAQRLNRAAANALLKTLEEPTPRTFLLLVADNRGNLPATIVSRCQRTCLNMPSHGTALAWLASLGDAPAKVAQRLELAEGAPLAALEIDDSIVIFNNELYDFILQISQGQRDPVAAAARWAKEEPGRALDGMARMLRAAIRGRSEDSKSITDLGSPRLHNAFRGRTLPTLFGWLDEILTIRRGLGTGLNTELQLRSVLVAMAKR